MDRNKTISDIEQLSKGKRGEGEIKIVTDYTDEQIEELQKTWAGLIINERRNG